jgi:nucleoside-diphosphate-sugar epimerase
MVENNLQRTVRDTWVCVMGGAGFLGSHLVNHLIEERNCEVLVLDNLISGQKKHVHPKAHFRHYDIMDDEQMTAYLLKEWKIEYVLNYAAEPYIPECFERPMHFFEINATAVLKVLNACQIAGIKGLLQVSSAEIYGDMKGKIKESDPITPHSTYGVSKMAADGLVQVRWREAKVPAIALRQFNSAGENETHEYVIPEIISQLHKGSLVSLGNNSSRDFIYAGDAVRMAVELLEKGQFGEVYNLGSEESIKIYDLANKIGRIMGYNYITIQQDPARMRPWEIWHLQSDNTKIHSVIEARPKVSLDEALRRTVNYFNNNNHIWDW